MDEFNEIIEADLPEVEKLAQAFGWVTNHWVERAQKEIELARAINDRETLVKEQIKTEMMKFARSIFQDCHVRVTGRRAWDE